MEKQHQHDKEDGHNKALKNNINYWKWTAIVSVGILIFTQLFNVGIKSPFAIEKGEQNIEKSIENSQNISELNRKITPTNGVIFAVKWGDIGKKMVEAGVIDKNKFKSLYEQRGGIDQSNAKLLYGDNNGKIEMDKQNSGFLLNLFWALGLANKNPILDNGPIVSQRYGGDASRFASTGGWTMSKGNTMNYYSKYNFINLTKEQQKMVEEVSKNIYRPCCNNPVYFPDCNHGMAMLGLLELSASQGINESGMYKIALQANSYWFPSVYTTIAQYFQKQGTNWNQVNPKTALGSAYSSASGYRQILSEVKPIKSQNNGSGSGCGV